MGEGLVCLAGRCSLTTEKQLIAPVRSWQLTNVFYSMAHYPGKVTSVTEASHNDAVQVHGFDEGAEECALEPKDVPPGKEIRERKHMGGGMATREQSWENQQRPTHGLEG